MIHLTEYQNTQGETVGYFVEAIGVADGGDDLTHAISAGIVARGGFMHYAKSFDRGFEARSKARELAYLCDVGVVCKTEIINEMEGA